jgi:hypothetical protein
MNPVVHFEINAPMGGKAALQKFYKDTFGWQVMPAGPTEYGMLPAPDDGRGIGGAVDETDRGPEVVLYIEVEDIHAAVAQAVANGASLVQDVTEIPGMVTMALFRDPAGNLVGMADAVTPEA